MINNSAVQKWARLAQKQLDHQFLNEMIRGLQCSPFEAQAILEAVYQVYQPYFDTSGTLKPGQMLFPVVAIENSPNTHLKDSKQLTVTLTLDAGAEDLRVRKRYGVPGLRRYRMQRVCYEAFQQGGVLTIEDLANRLFNCGERTLSRDLQELQKDNIALPLRSTIKDMGRAISHRTIIIKDWLRGQEYTEIARSRSHSIPAIQNYVSKFKRVVALTEEAFDAPTIAFLVKISPALVDEYQTLYTTAPIVPHRQEALHSLVKKSRVSAAPPERPHRRQT